MTSSARLGSKGQTGHVFTFLMAVIVIIATIFIAGKLISSFTNTACEAGMVEFFDELDAVLDANNVAGSRNTVTVKTPCDSHQICFVDSRIIETVVANDPVLFSSSVPLISIAVQEGVEENIFLSVEDTYIREYDKRIILSGTNEDAFPTELCLNSSQGRFELKAEGFGRFVKVSEVPR